MKCGFVSILGRPNAGKSTLLNALLGQKLAIVTAKPQTTRTSIQGVVTAEDYQIVFIDTPGIHRSNTLMNKRMMDTVRATASADVVLYLIDTLEPFREEDAEAIDLVKKLDAPAIAVLNKVDKLQDKAKLLALIEHLRGLARIRRVHSDLRDERHRSRFAVERNREAPAGGRGNVP